jgi:octaprenyl-diphosphate synthase
MEHGTPEEQQLARDAIEQGGTDRFDIIFEAIQRSGALDYTLRCAQREAQAAADAIAAFPDTPHKAALIALCAYSTGRNS